jgi:hypothetical protein
LIIAERSLVPARLDAEAELRATPPDNAPPEDGDELAKETAAIMATRAKNVAEEGR